MKGNRLPPIALCLLLTCFAPFPRAASADETRMQAWDYHVKLEKASIFSDLQWRAAGPAFIGGRIESITCPSGGSFTIYVGAGSGNLWKTVNNGTTWKPIFDHESTFAIGSVAVSAVNPEIVWVGTGEVLMARSSYAGTGVFKSLDGGETWRNMGLHDTYHIGKVLIDPNDPDIVYVAAIGHNYTFNEERGLFKTTDGGETWAKVLYISEKAGVVDVAMDPSNSSILYAIAWERDRKAWNNVESGAGSGIYKSMDAGRSWKRLTEGLPTGEHVGRFGIAISASNPDVVYALLDNQERRPGRRGRSRAIGGEVFRSNDKGETWKKVNVSALQTSIGYDFCLIRVSPDNEDEIYVLGNNLLTSKDGGITYRHIEGTLVHLLAHGSKVLHLDHHDLWIDPHNPDRLLLGNDGGFHMSHDRGASWLHFNNFPIGEFYAVSVDMADPYRIWGGTQDNAALYGPSTHVVADDTLDPWKHVYLDQWGGGDSYFTLVDPEDPDIVYYEHQFGVLRRKNMGKGTTKDIMPKPKKGEPPLRRNWMTPYVISHHDPATLYYGGNKLYKSTDRGDHWTCISPDLTTDPGPEKRGDVPFGTLTTVSESPREAGLIIAGTDDGVIQMTVDDGETWTRIDKGLPEKWVSRVVASRHETRTVYVSFTGYREDDFEKYLYMTTDLGRSWRSIASNLPSESINVIGEDPGDKNILYVGTDPGVYVSLDRGGTWHSLCNNLPTTPVHDLVVHPRENELVIGTHGRSIFVLDVEPIQNFNKEK